ncbi:MAG TPA: septal ring lytic transglycosylase RlpA family protein [Coriobacteriia bacterium]
MKVLNRSSRPVFAAFAKAATVAAIAAALLGSGLVSGVPAAEAATRTHAARLTRYQAAKLARYRRHLAKKAGVDTAKAARYKRHLAKRTGRGGVTVSRALPPGWKVAEASWYGPGLYGSGLAAGGRLKIASMIVAHKKLPFGTRVQFYYNGKSITVPVMDRGPYVSGREWDLGPGTARYLGMMGVARIQYRILGRS